MKLAGCLCVLLWY